MGQEGTNRDLQKLKEASMMLYTTPVGIGGFMHQAFTDESLEVRTSLPPRQAVGANR